MTAADQRSADLPLELQLDRFRGHAEAFQTELNRAYYHALAGYRDSPGLEAVYDRYPDLFELERTPEIERALTAVEPTSEQARRLRYLREFAASAFEEEAAKHEEERYLAAEAEAVVRIDGEEVPFRGVRTRIRNTPDGAKRREISLAALEVTRELQPPLRDGIEAAHEAARRLGGEDYVSYRARLSGFDVEFLLGETARLLEETESVYLDLFEFFARRELSVPRSEVKFWDLPFLLRGGRFDAFFEVGDMVESVSRMVGAIGLDAAAEGNVELDLEARPKKSPRAFCSPIRIPQEIKLVIRPTGGADDYQAFLHELGHSLHFGYVDPAAPFEFRNLGDNSITETFAISFDHCLLLPGWLRDVRGMRDSRDFLLLQWFEELYMLRRYAGKLRYELELHARGPRPEMADRYSEELSQATAVETPRERYLEDVDPRFYAVCYLQAWMLSALLHRALRERFDSDWYRNPRSGPFLRGLFARGQRDSPAELAAQLGVGELGFGALLEWVKEGVEG